MKSLSRRRKILFTIVAAGIALLILEGFGSALLSLHAALKLRPIQEDPNTRYDETLGWTSVPGRRFPDIYGKGRSYTTNALGLRAGRDYTERIPEGLYRIVCLGDSFTMGVGVDDTETYPAQVEAMCPQIEAVNMGLGGYGVDQEYLWYRRDGGKLETNVLLLAFIDHDFYRMRVDKYLGYPKPVLRVTEGRLVVDNVPVPRLWNHVTSYRRAQRFAKTLAMVRIGQGLLRRSVKPPDDDDDPSQFDEVATHVLDDLIRMSSERRQRFVLVRFPLLDRLVLDPSPEARWVARYAASRSVPFLDLSEDFKKVPTVLLTDFHLPGDDHYSALGNRFVAETLLRRLRELHPDMPR